MREAASGSKPPSGDMTQNGQAPPVEQNVFGKAASCVDGFFASKFYSIGYFVGSRPWTSIGLTMVWVVICAGGFSQAYSETRSDKLWIPQDTEAQGMQSTYNRYFPPFSRMQMILMEAKSGSALDKAVLTDALALHMEIEKVKNGDDTLRTLCIEKPGDGHPCFINSILSYWDFDATKLEADPSPLTTINAAGKSKEDMNRMVGEPVYDDSGKLVSAKAIQSTYFMQSNRKLEGGSYEDERGDEWEDELLKVLKCDEPNCDGDDCICDYKASSMKIYVLAHRSWRDVFGKVIRGDVGLINMAFAIMIIYVTLNLGGLCHKIKMRALLALGCIVSIVLAGICGYGLAMWFQFDYTPVMSVMPFVLIGIGVDDSFVIMNALDGVATNLEVPDRIATALSHAGVSIFITSLTDFVAFAISVSSALPALSAFCMYAAMSILMLFVLQVTLFTAFATFDNRRVNADLIDCCPCICRKGCPCCPTVPQAEAIQDGKDQNQLCCAPSPHKGGRVGSFLEGRIGPCLAHPIVAIVVVVLALGFAGCCAWQASELGVEEARAKFVPDDSYVHMTLQKQEQYFGLLGESFAVVTEGGDYFASQAALCDVGNRLDKLDFVKPSNSESFESWAESYRLALRAGSNIVAESYIVAGSTGMGVVVDSSGYATDKTQYYAGLKIWLSGQGARFAKDVVWVDDNDAQKGIKAARINGELKTFNTKKDEKILVDSERAVEVMDDLQSEVESWKDMPNGKAFAYSRKFLSWETFRIIHKEVFQSLGLCLAAVFVITLIFLAHPLTSGLVFLCVVLVIIDILGCMNMWGLAIDNVTVIQLVIAVGLSVDYSAHIGHCFMTKAGTRGERVIATLGDVGAAVLNGGISTFLAVLLLAASKSYVFRVLFQTFFLTVVFGLFHGMVVLPAALSLIGPECYAGRAAKIVPDGQTVGKPADVTY